LLFSRNERVTKRVFDLFFDRALGQVHLVPMAKGNSTKNSTKAVRTMVAAKVSHASSITASAPTLSDVALRAYEIYEREGRPEGRHLEHWAQAQAELGI
jgi:hypothetical protein